MGGIGKCCCGSVIDCTDRNNLPATLTYRSSILRANWIYSPTFSGDCCWFAEIISNGSWVDVCSAPVAGPFGTETVLVATYRYIKTQFYLSYDNATCGSQPSPVDQWILSVTDTYGVLSNNLSYTPPPTPSCATLAASLQFGFSGTYTTTWIERRLGYYSTFPAGTYTLTPADRSNSCSGGGCGISPGATGLTITNSGTGQSVSMGPDTSDWSIVVA